MDEYGVQPILDYVSAVERFDLHAAECYRATMRLPAVLGAW